MTIRRAKRAATMLAALGRDQELATVGGGPRPPIVDPPGDWINPPVPPVIYPQPVQPLV